MKTVRNLVAVLFAILLLSSCSSERHTAAIVPVETKVVSMAIADLEVMPNQISRTYSWGYRPFGDPNIDQVKQSVTAQMLRQAGADVLVEPQYIVEHRGFLRGGSVTVIGYPAKYKNFRSLQPGEYHVLDTIIKHQSENRPRHKTFLFF